MMNLSIHKKVLIGIIIAILMAASLLASSYFYSQHTVNSTLARINKSENERIAKVVQDTEIRYAMEQNSEKLNFGDGFNYETNLALIIDNNIQINKLSEELNKECDDINKKYEVKTNFFTKLYTKQKHSKLTELKEILKDHGSYCADEDGQTSYSLFLNEMDRSNNEIAKLLQQGSENKNGCAPLSKYANGKYKVENLNQIDTTYTPRYSELINDAINVRKLFYEHCIAVTDKNPELANLKYKEYEEADKKLGIDGEIADKEYRQKNKDSSDIKESITLFNLLKDLNTNPQKTQYSSGIWSANLLYGALDDHMNNSENGTYPKASNIQELMPILIERTPELENTMNTEYVGYSSNGDDKFNLTFGNEITNTSYSIKY